VVSYYLVVIIIFIRMEPYKVKKKAFEINDYLIMPIIIIH
jgi:hypothetical protein